MSSWNNNIEKVVKIIEKQSRLYKKMHMEIAISSYNKYSFFMIVGIIISPLSGIITAIGTVVCKDLDDMYIYTITGIILSFLTNIK
jgi:hypothetical protein